MLRTILTSFFGVAVMAAVGCDETVSHEKEVKVTDDQKVVKEETVKRDVDDGVEKITKETEKTVEPR